jgi:hypothetical protein
MKTSTATRIFPLILTSFAALALAIALVPGAQAQTWNEVGDAGDLVATAQSTVGSGSLTAINGNLGSPTDVDLYCIKMLSVPPAGLPLIQLQCVVNNGPNVWLFDAAGNGVFTNATCSSGNKTIVAPNVSLATGTYYVAVSYTGVDPQSAGGAIWLSGLPAQRAPDGPGAGGALTGWAGSAIIQPVNPYHIALNFMSYCDAPTASGKATWGSLKIRYR